ncbi:MAG TPA: hypothetical protein VGA51_12380 [Casimicrobiaceae bacterium]
MAWHDDVRVEALWTINEHANAWGWIDGAWRKFDDAHEDSVTNMTILAAHAKAGGRSVNARIEGDRLKEIYVW